MIVDCISDLHGHYPKLEGGDLLIVAGDLTASDTDKNHLDFIQWLAYMQKYENKYNKIIYISGNHDNFLFDKNRYGNIKTPSEWNIEYLCDSGTEFEGLKIWGTPWTKSFPRMNPKCKAFTFNTEEELYDKFVQIPEDIDILISHGPPYGIFDGILKEDGSDLHVGSTSLRNILLDGKHFINLKHVIFGHIHEQGGRQFSTPLITFTNCSYVNERYRPVNPVMRIIL